MAVGPRDRKRNQQRKRKNQARSEATHRGPMAARSKRGKVLACARCGAETARKTCPECGGCPRCGDDFRGFGSQGPEEVLVLTPTMRAGIEASAAASASEQAVVSRTKAQHHLFAGQWPAAAAGFREAAASMEESAAKHAEAADAFRRVADVHAKAADTARMAARMDRSEADRAEAMR